MDENMVLRIARALAPTAFDENARYSTSSARGAERQRAIGRARMILTIVRDPTGSMIDAGNRSRSVPGSDPDARETWIAMIDHAIADGAPIGSDQSGR